MKQELDLPPLLTLQLKLQILLRKVPWLLLEPFIDTIIVCTMTALVIIITGAYGDPSNADFIGTIKVVHSPLLQWEV